MVVNSLSLSTFKSDKGKRQGSQQGYFEIFIDTWFSAPSKSSKPLLHPLLYGWKIPSQTTNNSKGEWWRERWIWALFLTPLLFFESYWASNKSARFSADYYFVAGKHWEIQCYSPKVWSVRASNKIIILWSQLQFLFSVPYELISKTNMRNLLGVSRIKICHSFNPWNSYYWSICIWNRFKDSITEILQYSLHQVACFVGTSV